jgi:OOP family OmpA-OmpF porin
MEGTQLEPAQVESHWEPFQALDPRFVTTRAATLLRPPANVTLEFADGVLTARGPAPVQWIVDSERLAPAINGVRRFTYEGREAELQLKDQIEGISTLFPKGQSTMPPEQFVRVNEAAVLLTQLNVALNLHGRGARVEILGHTDNDGSDESNGPLSEARATTLLRLLGSRPLAALTFSTRGVGSTVPATPGVAESDKELNRRASFRVTLSESPAPGGQP